MEKFLFMAADLNAEEEAEFFEQISTVCSFDEMQALKIGIAYFRLLKYPELKQAMKAAISEELFRAFNLQKNCN